MGTTNGTVRTMDETTQQGPGVSAAIVRAPQVAIEPQNFRELSALAEDAARTKFFGAQSREQAMLIMMRGRDMGFSYAQSLSAFHVIQGKPTLSADAMQAVCLSHPEVCKRFALVDESAKHATYVVQRVGEEPARVTYSLDDAEREGLAGKDMWRKFPRRMLKARAKSNAARDHFPELLLGIYSTEEMQDAEPRGYGATEYVAEPQTQQPDPMAFEAFKLAVKGLSTKKEFSEFGTSVIQASKRGAITQEQTLEINAMYEARKAEIKAAKVPAAPPSEPAAAEGEVEQ